MRLSSKVSSGSLAWAGEYSECGKISQLLVNKTTAPHWLGKYCYVAFPFRHFAIENKDEPSRIVLFYSSVAILVWVYMDSKHTKHFFMLLKVSGICVPSECSSEALAFAINRQMHKVLPLISSNLTVTCQEPRPFDGLAHAAM